MRVFGRISPKIIKALISFILRMRRSLALKVNTHIRITFLTTLTAFFSCSVPVEEKAAGPAGDSVSPRTVQAADTTDIRMAYLPDAGILVQNFSDSVQSQAELIEDSASSGFERLVFLGSQSHESGVTGRYSTAALHSFRNGAYRLQICKSESAGQPFRMTIQLSVKDFSTWKWLFDGEERNRVNAGMTLLQLGNASDDANSVFVMFAIPDIARAREMLSEPGIEDKMIQSGVVGKATACFWRPALKT